MNRGGKAVFEIIYKWLLYFFAVVEIISSLKIKLQIIYRIFKDLFLMGYWLGPIPVFI
jgi:hypothetical protein